LVNRVDTRIVIGRLMNAAEHCELLRQMNCTLYRAAAGLVVANLSRL
jgi:hypothetical protein